MLRKALSTPFSKKTQKTQHKTPILVLGFFGFSEVEPPTSDCLLFFHWNLKPSSQAVRNMLQNKALHKFEAACIANLCPDNYEEAKALIPSLEVRSGTF